MQNEMTLIKASNAARVPWSFEQTASQIALAPFGRFYRTDRACIVTERKIEENEIFSLAPPCGK